LNADKECLNYWIGRRKKWPEGISCRSKYSQNSRHIFLFLYEIIAPLNLILGSKSLTLHYLPITLRTFEYHLNLFRVDYGFTIFRSLFTIIAYNVSWHLFFTFFKSFFQSCYASVYVYSLLDRLLVLFHL
jgi:hypothetical protein